MTTENTKYSTKNLLVLSNEHSNITGHKINTQKSVVLLYSNNELSEKRNKENNLIYNSFEKKYIGTNLTKTCILKTIKYC
jgi:hypothetical protein